MSRSSTPNPCSEEPFAREGTLSIEVAPSKPPHVRKPKQNGTGVSEGLVLSCVLFLLRHGSMCLRTPGEMAAAIGVPIDDVKQAALDLWEQGLVTLTPAAVLKQRYDEDPRGGD